MRGATSSDRCLQRAQKGYDQIAALPEVSVRNVSRCGCPKKSKKEVMSIFNDAWSDNWGYVPLSRAELAKLADEFKLIPGASTHCRHQRRRRTRCFRHRSAQHQRAREGSPWPAVSHRRRQPTLRRRSRNAHRTSRASRRAQEVSSHETLRRPIDVHVRRRLAKSGQRLGIDWGELSGRSKTTIPSTSVSS